MLIYDVAPPPSIGGTLPFAAFALVGGYLLGSIPFGVIAARIFGLGNLRAVGSGNIGATNVLRTGNKWAAAFTLLGDGGKGAAAVLIARAIAGDVLGMTAGLSVFLGHLFPVWLHFKGGKGVATFLGIALALDWRAGLAACATWLLVAALLRFSSLAALTAALLTPLYLWSLDRPEFAALALVIALLVFLTHRANIGRLIAGTEPKIGAKGGIGGG